ncbi:hypothetical protein TL16_g12902, partial [Triparma laevis f. inornata]
PTSTPTPDPLPFSNFDLTMSDEFNTNGRTFKDGDDPMWTAIDKNDYTNNALHYYDEGKTSIVGFNDITLKKVHETKNFKSAMLQSWNKFCFTGGLIESEVILPGKHDIGGLWPAFWILGNLARHTYVGSSNNIWPWSQSKCVEEHVDSQKLSACLKTGHFGMEEGVGRGAPEIDIFEVQPDQFGLMSVGQPFASHSLQIAPGKSSKRPGPGNWPGPGEWYEKPKLKFGPETCMNIAFYGTDAISQNRQLGSKHFTGLHKFKLHWEPPSIKHGDGFINWYLDDELILGINGTSLKEPEGAEIPSEPSYVLVNTAISKDWGFPKTCPVLATLVAGANYKINFIRLYQDKDNPVHKVGCSTPERPTRKWIEGNAKSYMK